jgi:hypothetical protein
MPRDIGDRNQLRRAQSGDGDGAQAGADGLFLELAGGGAGQGWDERDADRAFEACQAVADPGDELGLGYLGVRAQDDDGLRGLAPFGGGDADDGDLGDGRMASHHALHLGRIHVLAAG